MVQSLKVGVAGLGTVGAALIAQIVRERDLLTMRAGRPIEVVAVCARSRGKDRGVDLKKMKWFDDPIALAKAADIDVFVELMGGAGDPAKAAVEAALAVRQVGRHRQQGAAGAARRQARDARGEARRRAQFRGGRRRRHSDRAHSARGIRRQRHRAHLRHPQRHLQLHPDADGAGGARLRRLPEGRAAARLCRGRSDLRHRGPRHRAEAVDPGEPRLRHQGRRERDLRRGHLLDPAGRHRRRRRARLPRQAARRRREDRQGHRAARASDHGAQGLRHRPGDGRHQCRHHRSQRHQSDHVDRPGRRRHGDRLVGVVRHRRRRARHAAAAVRPAGGEADGREQGADAAPRGRLLHPPAGARQARHRGDHREASGASRRFRWNRSCSAIPRAPPRPRPNPAPSRLSSSLTRRPRMPCERPLPR